MSRVVYISCSPEQQTSPQVKSLCGFLNVSGCQLKFPPRALWDFYRNVEDAIDPCDALVVVVGGSHSESMQICHELLYASALNRMRYHPRPRLFALRLTEGELPVMVREVALEWIDVGGGNYQLLLEDLPERMSSRP